MIQQLNARGFTGIKTFFRFIKGRLWCLTFHSPVLRCIGGYGGYDHFGRRRKAYHNMWCVLCDNKWEQADRGERCVGAFLWHTRKSEKTGGMAL